MIGLIKRSGPLLTLMAVACVLAAVIVPHFRVAMQHSKQKRTMADLRTLATAWEARATDTHTYAVSARDDRVVPVSAAELRRVLVPKYVRVMPEHDGWGNPFHLAASSQEYIIRSSGKDGLFDHILGATTSFDCDIVYSNGSFFEYPEGVL